MSEVKDASHHSDEELYEDALDDLTPPHSRPDTMTDGDVSESIDSEGKEGSGEQEEREAHAASESLNSGDSTDPSTHVADADGDDDKDGDSDGDDKGLDVDELALKDRDSGLTEEQLETLYEEAVKLKEEGNELFRCGELSEAVERYTHGLLTCPLCQTDHRAVLYSNRAACFTKLDKDDEAIADCTKALELSPSYLKVLLRRAELYEKTDKLDEALADYQKSLELDPTLRKSREACHRLPDAIKVRNEKMKEEMISKLKDLGNMVLRPFGLSTNNFKMEQDPNTGSYSVQFQQNPTS